MVSVRGAGAQERAVRGRAAAQYVAASRGTGEVGWGKVGRKDRGTH